MKLQKNILLFQISSAISTLLIVSFVTLFLLWGKRWITDVAQGSIVISILTLVGFYAVNLFYKYRNFSHTLPIKVSWIIVMIIGILLLISPSLGWIAYWLSWLVVWFYYSGINMIMVHDVHYTIRPKHSWLLQTINGIIGIVFPILIWLSFKYLWNIITYHTIFVLIIISWLITTIMASKYKAKSHFTYRSLPSLRIAFSKINVWYLIAAGLLWAGALKAQLDVIIPHTINLQESNISFILSWIKIISLITVFFISQNMQRHHYAKLILYVIVPYFLATLIFMNNYNSVWYTGFAIISTIWWTLYALWQTVITPRWIESMHVDSWSVNLLWEITMAFVRIVISVFMLYLWTSYPLDVLWKSILFIFVCCLSIWGLIFYKNGKKLEM